MTHLGSGYGKMEAEALRQRLSRTEYVARDLNAKVPLTRRCAYPLSAPGLAGGCQCWGCYNARMRAQRMLRTSAMPQYISERKRGYVIK